MEQLWNKADRFRNQGRLQDQDLEEIIIEIKAGEEFKVGEESCNAETAAKDKQKTSPWSSQRRPVASAWNSP